MANFVQLCARGEVEGVVEALEGGVEVNTVDGIGRTGLMVAAVANREEVVEGLLAWPGVGVNLRNDWGLAALHWAAMYSSAGMVRRLLEVPEVESREQGGATPLLLAAKYGREEVARELEQEGADLEARDLQGRGMEHWPGGRAVLRQERERRERVVEERREAAATRSVGAWVRDMAIFTASLLESAPTTGDFMLVGEGGEVACHTTVLVARCPTLAQGALSTWREGVEGRWRLRNMEGELVKVEVVRDLLSYIYTNNIPKEMVEESAVELLEFGHMFHLPGLVDVAKEVAIQQMAVDNSLHTLATLHKFGMVDVEDAYKAAAIRFVRRNLGKVRKTKDWETFATTCPDLVKRVVGGNRMSG